MSELRKIMYGLIFRFLNGLTRMELSIVFLISVFSNHNGEGYETMWGFRKRIES